MPDDVAAHRRASGSASASASSEDEFAEFDEEVYSADVSADGYNIEVTGGNGGEKPVMEGMGVRVGGGVITTVIACTVNATTTASVRVRVRDRVRVRFRGSASSASSATPP